METLCTTPAINTPIFRIFNEQDHDKWSKEVAEKEAEALTLFEKVAVDVQGADFDL